MTTTTHPPGEGVVSLDRRDLAITGMTCASCVANVESALRGVSGVKSADVNLATERASVQLDPTRADLPALVRAVERAGYGALALSSDQKERAVVEDRERAARREQLVARVPGVRAGDAGAALGRGAVLRERLGRGAASPDEHEHAHRRRHHRRVRDLGRRDVPAADLHG